MFILVENVPPPYPRGRGQKAAAKICFSRLAGQALGPRASLPIGPCQAFAPWRARGLWCGQRCSPRNRRKIFIKTPSAVMASRAAIHHSMLRQLRLHSSSCFFCRAIFCPLSERRAIWFTRSLQKNLFARIFCFTRSPHGNFFTSILCTCICYSALLQ